LLNDPDMSASNNLIFEQMAINPRSTRNFSYLIGDPDTGSAVLVDPAFEPDRFIARIDALELDLEHILNTHGHQDHTSANDLVARNTGAPVANHPDDRVDADLDLSHGDELTAGAIDLTVLHTPGHSPGSCCFVVQDRWLLSGDTLFVGKVGGTSNSGTDARQQYESLHNVLMHQPESLEVYPGHDYGPMPHSTLAWEQEHNPFLLRDSFESFCRLKENWEREKPKWEEHWAEITG